MAHHWSEGVSTLRFTAREFQQELVEEALKHNLLTFPPPSAAFFVSLKVIQELAYQIRCNTKKKTIIVSPIYKVNSLAFDLTHLTDLRTIAISSIETDMDINGLFLQNQVIVCTSEVLENLFIKNIMKMSYINLLIIEHCHLINQDANLRKIMNRYQLYNKTNRKSSRNPKILAFSYPLFASHNDETTDKFSLSTKKLFEEISNEPISDRSTILNESILQYKTNQVELECLKKFTDLYCPEEEEQLLAMNNFQYWHIPTHNINIDKSNIVPVKSKNERSLYDVLEYRLEKLEEKLCCKTDMACDIVGLKRITGKPKEVILECKPLDDQEKCQHRKQLECYMKNTIAEALLFLKDHRYDPSEIYGDEYYDEELKAIPDPCNEPKGMLELFLYILEEAGPYAADKAAFALLVKLEKIKIKIPYERHFLLLCLISSVFVQIRAASELIFEKYPNEKEKVSLFTTPKVLRLMDILKLFKPSEITQKKDENLHNCEKIVQKSSSDSKPHCKKNFSKIAYSEPIHDNTLKVDSELIDEALNRKSEKIDNFSECNKTTINSCNVNNSEIISKEVIQSSATLIEIEKCDFKKLQLKIEKSCDKILLKSSEPIIELNEKINTDFETDSSIKGIKKISQKEKDSPAKLGRPNTFSKRADNFRGRGRGRGGKGYSYQNRHNNNNNDPDALCGLIFVEEPLLAKILSSLINEYCRNDDDLRFVGAQYTIDKVADPQTDLKEAEMEHKLQEDVLKRFRIHECNILVGTSFLEEGMDLPKCNLVVRWDVPNGYRSYARCRARARAPRSLFAMLMLPPPEPLIKSLGQYSYIEKMLIKMCGWQEPPASEEALASKFTSLIEAYRPSEAAVNLSSAVASLNRYCAKLPSDTFTRLVPLWTTEQITYRDVTLYICTIRLPINCPLKHHIVGHPMPNRVLARRMAALQACRALHRAGELDDNLMPIGKEGFHAMEADWLSLPPSSDLPKFDKNSGTQKKPSPMNNVSDNFFDGPGGFEPRPGTTKRKQYYYKKVAQALTGCRPILGEPCLAYQINSWLACPLPERHNTRGRKLHPPEAYAEGFAILTSKPIQKIPIFPIFTRSGEVRVALQQLPGSVVISSKRQKLIHYFMKYTFAEVLRVHNHLMLFDDEGKQNRNSYYIVPTSKVSTKDGKSKVVIDWNFLELIYDQTNIDNNLMHIGKLASNVINSDSVVENDKILSNTYFDGETIVDSKCELNTKLSNSKEEISDDLNCVKFTNTNEFMEGNLPNPYLGPNETFQFDSEKFRDAVVMPWYRNQDQPQYFYVAEICWHLSPRSSFPSATHATFEEYYRHKYGVKITQTTQPLLDVDHTSARLNLLTPRFVNRKGVALPTSSERTKRAKRESLEQKQILVPELCCAHPFRGALWRAAVALPCILYRINSLLLADEIRKSVALSVALGKPSPNSNFQWPSLDFGWSLAEVLAGDNLKDNKNDPQKQSELKQDELQEDESNNTKKANKNEISSLEKTANEILKECEDADCEGTDAFEIGMWSNDMASNVQNSESDDLDEDESSLSTTKLPDNLTICTPIGGGIDWNLVDLENLSPKKNNRNSQRKFSMADSEMSYGSSDFDMSNMSGDESDSDCDVIDLNINSSDAFPENSGIRIEFKSINEAEAIEIDISDNVTQKNSKDILDVEKEREVEEISLKHFKDFFYTHKNDDEESQKRAKKFEQAISKNEEKLKNNGVLVKYDQNLEFLKPHYTNVESISNLTIEHNSKLDIHQQTEKLNKNVLNCSDEDDEDAVNPFPEIFEMALSKHELLQLHELLFPYESFSPNGENWCNSGLFENGQITLDKLEKNKRKILEEIKQSMDRDKWMKYNFFSMKDLDEEGFENSFMNCQKNSDGGKLSLSNFEDNIENETSNLKTNFKFSFDYQPDLENHPGPSPSLILQALTMSNANDGINLERLETIGDSFLKYAITTYLYCTYQNIHEGKLSHLRSKQVSNLNLYRLGRCKSLGSRMVAYKFEPHDNWLPPCHRVPPHLERALIDTHIPSSLWNIADMPKLTGLSKENVEKLVRERVAQFYSIPNKIKNSLNDRIEDENCIFHGKNSKLIKDLTTSCFESASRMEAPNKNCDISDVDIVNRCNDLSNESATSPMKSFSKDGTYKCTCVVYSGYNDVNNICDVDANYNDAGGEIIKLEGVPCFVPYNLITQHSIPDKSVADCVEALIGAYLIECGPRGALLFMAWLGIRVLPKEEIILADNHPFVMAMKMAEMSPTNKNKKQDTDTFCEPIDKDSTSEDLKKVKNESKLPDVEPDPYDCQDENSDFDDNEDWDWDGRIPGSLKPKKNEQGQWTQIVYGALKSPPSPLLRYVPDPEGELMQMLSGYEGLEKTLNYRFKDRTYLLQAMTHASYSPNRLTDCYQRLEFLGDAVLDYLITRQLYEDPRRHSPGALTDLRSALVNNTIFASLAVRHGMHKYFRHLSPGLNEVLSRFVKIQEENGHSISEDHYLIQEDECEQAEDVEVPKALGDLFESIAGAIFLDSGMSLDAVWRVYHALMQREIEAFSESVPKSPVRELLEMEPETAKFGKPEKLADGRRVRVTVEVLGVGMFKGVGRNYRIAKCTAAKCALRRLASASRKHKSK